MERWTELKRIAENAMKEGKVFMIKCGGFYAIRRALLERGWLEKYDSNKVTQSLIEFLCKCPQHQPQRHINPITFLQARHLPPSNMDPRKLNGKELSRVERMILYKFMEQHSVDFLWTTKRDRYDWLLSNKEVVISR